jgi:PKD repeat protein
MKRLKLIGAMAAFASLAFLFSCGGGSDDPGNGGGGNCSGLDVLFSATTSANVGQTVTPTNQTLNGVSYSWDFGDGSAPQTASTLAAPSHVYTQEGSFTITLTAYCEAGQTGGSDTHSSNITVIKEPLDVVAVPAGVFSPDGSNIEATEFLFQKVSDESFVHPVGVLYVLDLSSTTGTNSYSVDWGVTGQDPETYAGDVGLVGFAYTTTGTYDIKVTGYELQDQQGPSQDVDLTVTIEPFNKITVTSFTLHPALNDSLGSDRWEAAADHDDFPDEIGTEADLAFWSNAYGGDSSISNTSFVPLTSLGLDGQGTFNLRNLASIAADITEPISMLPEGAMERVVYAPTEPWNTAIDPILRNIEVVDDNSPLPYVLYFNTLDMITLGEVDVTADGAIRLNPFFGITEEEMSNLSPGDVSHTINDLSGNPFVTVNFTVTTITEVTP